MTSEMTAYGKRKPVEVVPRSTHYCSFCGLGNQDHRVAVIITVQHGGSICNSCHKDVAEAIDDFFKRRDIIVNGGAS